MARERVQAREGAFLEVRLDASELQRFEGSSGNLAACRDWHDKCVVDNLRGHMLAAKRVTDPKGSCHSHRRVKLTADGYEHGIFKRARDRHDALTVVGKHSSVTKKRPPGQIDRHVTARVGDEPQPSLRRVSGRYEHDVDAAPGETFIRPIPENS
jgi:hypothetical protein